ncbi:ABC transporter permease [Mariniblastus fucicola]|uniref:Macrolide export ATP-binding/permease protein MacB n=1 Tax=Mariniblastus fucicola TaxID=980251 RepID=A0A5B9PHD6_9BACT|nr:ABC transporter permease [Mariniblastus fucicola]QEG24036.1 Macrolide export ATP-binding/permease protein MacB [Mariniblastus fucicola]
MSRYDLIMMALQNLWARKSRTAFNIFGIVISCSMLLLVFAGTRGARDGLMNLFSESDFARSFAITPGRDRSSISESGVRPMQDLGQGIAEGRKNRISEKLNKDWENQNLPVTSMTLDKLDEVRNLPDIVSVLPNQSLRAMLFIGDQKVSSRASAFSAESSNLGDRVVVGNEPQSHSSRGKIWIDEYRAWRLGYKTDEELANLIGTKVTLRFDVGPAKLSPTLKRFAGIFGVKGASETELIAETFRKLFSDLDRTSLSTIEKESIRRAASRLGLDKVLDKSESSLEPGSHITREFEVAGIVKQLESSASMLFQMTRAIRSNDLLIDWRDYHAIEKATYSNRKYYYSVGAVKSPAELRQAVAAVEQAGFETRSALEILDKADTELGKVRLIVAAIALVILLIAAVGIMNTMIIAVMERTPEFGIMKAIGSKDSDIRWLMLIEAAFTGVLGALTSVGLAWLLDSVISRFARPYIETRIRQEFDFQIFVYSVGDILIVVAIAIFVCMLASLIPSRRAAKLDPVEAMK